MFVYVNIETYSISYFILQLGLGVLFDNQAELPSVVESAEPVKGVKLVQKISFGVTEQGTDVGEAGKSYKFTILYL